MVDSPSEVPNKAICEYARQLSIADVICKETAGGPAKSTPKPEDFGVKIVPRNQDVETRPGSLIPDEMLPKPVTPQGGGLPRFDFPSRRAPEKLPDFTPVNPDNKRPPENNSLKPVNASLPTVYVDIGHCTSKDPLTGKTDPGFMNSYSECEINKSVGRFLINDLKSAGVRVVATWNPDSPPPLVAKPEDLQRRVDVVNKDISTTGGDSIYVSIHHDDDVEGGSGQCVYYAQPKQAEAMTLARTIQGSAWKVREKANYLPGCIGDDTKTGNGKLIGLRGVNTVGVLIEGANVKNAYDKQNMPRPEFQRQEARKISEGIINYFKLKRGSERR